MAALFVWRKISYIH
ncbi:hypothetical protein MTR67_035267 [Solanum verrucosum]|uniref:Uncharacterized protein n=1 Tax=Solanum verrucosum TaxID=315347 RepID=A0AAF0ZK45_SOLVR|nr:hypothetical protein MTR67_035267 [Solanum verrucosum]